MSDKREKYIRHVRVLQTMIDVGESNPDERAALREAIELLNEQITGAPLAGEAKQAGPPSEAWVAEVMKRPVPAPAEQVKQPSALRVAFADFLVATHKSLHETADSLGIKLLRNEPAVSAPGESQAVGEEKHRPIGNYETLLSDLRRFIEHQFHERALALQEITSLQSSLDAARGEVEQLKLELDRRSKSVVELCILGPEGKHRYQSVAEMVAATTRQTCDEISDERDQLLSDLNRIGYKTADGVWVSSCSQVWKAYPDGHCRYAFVGDIVKERDWYSTKEAAAAAGGREGDQ